MVWRENDEDNDDDVVVLDAGAQQSQPEEGLPVISCPVFGRKRALHTGAHLLYSWPRGLGKCHDVIMFL